jgi:hypothetical protein
MRPEEEEEELMELALSGVGEGFIPPPSPPFAIVLLHTKFRHTLVPSSCCVSTLAFLERPNNSFSCRKTPCEREREREREGERGLDTKKWGNTQIPRSFHPEKRP